MWRIITLVAAVAVSLAPVSVMAAPDDRGNAPLAVPADAQVHRQEQQIADLEAQLQTMTTERDQLQSQVDDLKAQLAILNAGVGAGPLRVYNNGSSGPNHFAFGYCTYYVASKVYVPWYGNAITWLAGARAYGWPTGSTPRPGAIEVAALSSAGHVAWVERVNADGTYVVSEANYVGWDIVDWRTVVPSREALLGFIYT